jgi:D-hexose-6-phosphate mutarotase
MNLDIDELNRRFAIAGARFDTGSGNLTKLVIARSAGDAEIYLHGAHLAHFQPAGERPVLFLSQKSLYQPDKAIRGGVPICFPWFGPKAGDTSAPAHGVARISPWSVRALRQANGGVGVELQLVLPQFRVRYDVVVGRRLQMMLNVANICGHSVSFEAALHTYLAVGDIQRTTISGLEGCEYLDKTRGGARRRQPDEPIRFAEETDRVYLATRATCVVNDPVFGRRIIVEKDGSDSTVVWNPWLEKARALSDLADDEWTQMICVETSNVGPHAITLKAGESHAMRATVRAEA